VGEGGLMGLALHPAFPSPPFVYAMYTTSDGSGAFNRVRRFTAHAAFADEEQVIVDRIPAGLYHDGGRIAFGPDGMLYVGTGDARVPDLAQTASPAGESTRVTPAGSRPRHTPS